MKVRQQQGATNCSDILPLKTAKYYDIEESNFY
jgi:hypothetical protein